MARFTPQQQTALAIVPKFSCVLSVIGSGWIIAEVLRDERKLKMNYHRLMFVMSVGDVFRSAVQFLTTWPMPAYTPGVYGAAGTTATCTAQGTIFQFGLFFILYNAYLAFYYVCVLRWSWPNRKITVLEKWAFVTTITLGLSTSMAGLGLDLYNPATLWCWISPLNCQDKENQQQCERGENAWIYRYAFWYAWLWTAFALVVICMAVIFATVQKQQQQMCQRYGRDSGIGQRMLKCRKAVARQGIYYSITFALQISFNTATRVVQQRRGQTYFSLVLLMAFFAPLNGFWHGLIYLRPRFLHLKEMHPDWRTWLVVRHVLMRISRGNNNDQDDDHELGVISDSNLLSLVVDGESPQSSSRAKGSTDTFGDQDKESSDEHQTPNRRVTTSTEEGDSSSFNIPKRQEEEESDPKDTSVANLVVHFGPC